MVRYTPINTAKCAAIHQTLFTGGERRAALDLERLGMAAMQDDEWKDTEAAFHGALQRIETIYANKQDAEAARSVAQRG